MDFELGEVNPCTINTIERIPYQNGKVSWFLGIMVAMFYSQNSKNILLSSMNNWDRDELFKLFERFLDPSNNVYNINNSTGTLHQAAFHSFCAPSSRCS